MKVKINTLYDKKVYYRIYSVDGDKRALLTKGSFIGSTEFELPHTGREIIVRIRPKRGIKSFPAIFKTVFMNTFYWDSRYPSTIKESEDFNLFHEIRVTDNNKADEMVINYFPSPVSENSAGYLFHGVFREYLTCITHPYKEEIKSSKRASIIFDVTAGAILIGIIIGIAFLIGYFVRSC